MPPSANKGTCTEVHHCPSVPDLLYPVVPMHTQHTGVQARYRTTVLREHAPQCISLVLLVDLADLVLCVTLTVSKRDAFYSWVHVSYLQLQATPQV